MAFLNDSELSYTISDKLEIALQHVMEQVLKKNDMATYRTVYAAYNPSTYEETGDFGEAWDIKTTSGQKFAEGEFYFEPSVISVNPNADPPQHADIKGNSVAEYMADLIYDSEMGCIYRPTKRNAWKVVDTWLSDARLSKLFETGMNKAGLKWIRTGGIIQKDTNGITLNIGNIL